MMHNCMKFSFLALLTIVHSGGILDLKNSDCSVFNENDCHCTFELLTVLLSAFSRLLSFLVFL